MRLSPAPRECYLCFRFRRAVAVADALAPCGGDCYGRRTISMVAIDMEATTVKLMPVSTI